MAIVSLQNLWELIHQVQEQFCKDLDKNDNLAAQQQRMLKTDIKEGLQAW